MNTVLKYIEIGKKEAKLLCGGERLTGREIRQGLVCFADDVRSCAAAERTSRRKKFSGRC